MRILTVRQPWAWAIIHGGKDVENRVRNLAGDYRGPVAIHAGLALFEDEGQYREVNRVIVSELNGWPAGDADLWGSDSIEASDPQFVYGAIIGVVDLLDVHDGRSESLHSNDGERIATQPCSLWAQEDVHHLVLANPRPLAEPIPYKGALGLRKTNFGIEGDWLVEYHEPCKYPCAGVGYGCPPSCHMEPITRLEATS